jgi:hypothetical protein
MSSQIEQARRTEFVQTSRRAGALKTRPGTTGPAIIAIGIASCTVAILLVLGVAVASVI